MIRQVAILNSMINRFLQDLKHPSSGTMAGPNTLTVGFALGWDYMADENKTIWIYQNKPWFGLSIGLNIN
ncbi:MAG TPA: hypothetical protein PKH83_06555 [Cyclobacteriaceae bacterium]|nr:hypothetical protein [Cyclobacteriaceae bacterium]